LIIHFPISLQSEQDQQKAEPGTEDVFTSEANEDQQRTGAGSEDMSPSNNTNALDQPD
jgi:hypothetical protein